MYKTRRVKGLKQNQVQPSNIDQIKQIFQEVEDGTKHSYLHQCLERKIPIQIGTSCDPFMPCEKEYRRTYQCLKLLRDFGYTCMITTKGLISDEYFDLLRDLRALVHVTITTDDPTLAAKLEPGAPTPQERIDNLKRLNDAEIETALRLWPIMPKLNERPWRLFDKVADAGTKKVVASWLRLQKYPKFLERLNKALGFDYLESLKDYPLVQEKDYYTPRYDYKVEVLKEMKAYANLQGMEFYTPNSPVMNGWKCCCGLDHDKAPWALKLNGWRVGEGISFEDYIEPYGCPFEKQFREKWDSGWMKTVFNDVKFFKPQNIYLRETDKQKELI